jgi:hypothetical protein
MGAPYAVVVTLWRLLTDKENREQVKDVATTVHGTHDYKNWTIATDEERAQARKVRDSRWQNSNVSKLRSKDEEGRQMSVTTLEATAFCTSCGKALQTGNRFCGKCGASANESANPPTPNSAPVASSQAAVSAANYVGLSDYYQREFSLIESSRERYQGKWNWSAFLFGGIWALTKGLWVPALIAFVGSIFTGGLVGLIYWFIFGARGNYMYYRKVTRNLNPAY